MTSLESSQLCRITVIGPDHKADLAVPSTTTVGSLLPVFLRHTVAGSDGDQGGDAVEHEHGSWVLQRIGEQPLDVDGTPESLDLLEGEEIYLRPAASPLPELHFDDLAEGIAESVEQRRDHWQPDYRRPTFLVLSSIATLVVAALVLSDGVTAVRMGSAGVLSVLLLAGAAGIAYKLADRTLALLAGLASCGFAGIGGLGWLDGVAGEVTFTSSGVAGAGCALLVAALAAVGVHVFLTRDLPLAPFLAVTLAALLTIMGLWFFLVLGLSSGQSAGVAGVVCLGVVIFAPKVVVKAARLRGPQLPKTSAELSFDIEPLTASDVREKTALADQYLSVAVGCAALGMIVAFAYVMDEPGWAHWVLVVLLASAVLLRSRTFLNVWQRSAMAAAGAAGAIMLIGRLWRISEPGWQVLVLLGVLLLVVVLVLAALRPPPRRLLPIWGHTADVLDMITAIGVIPVLLQVLGIYAWARGLFG